MANAASAHTPYNYAFNDPVLLNDPRGDYPPTTLEKVNGGGGGLYGSGFSGDAGGFHHAPDWVAELRSVEGNAFMISSSEFNEFYGTQSNEAKWAFAQKLGISTSDPNAIAATVEDGFRDRHGRLGIYQMTVSKEADQNGSDGWSMATEMVFSFAQRGIGILSDPTESGLEPDWVQFIEDHYYMEVKVQTSYGPQGSVTILNGAPVIGPYLQGVPGVYINVGSNVL